MRLAVLSDIHGNLVALEAVLADLESLGGADVTWVLGDLALGGPRPVECIRRIRAMADAAKEAAEKDASQKGKLRLVSGNTDRYLVTGTRPRIKPPENEDEMRAAFQNSAKTDARINWTAAQLSYEDYDFLRKLGGECDLNVPSYGGVIGYHAVPGDDEPIITPNMPDHEIADTLLDREGRLAIYGHIHKQWDRDLTVGGWRVINVGSIGMSFDMPGKAQWGLFTFQDGNVKVDLRAIPYDVEVVIADLNTVGIPAPEMTIDLLRSGRP
jgi:predicted phosphodiesterase